MGFGNILNRVTLLRFPSALKCCCFIIIILPIQAIASAPSAPRPTCAAASYSLGQISLYGGPHEAPQAPHYSGAQPQLLQQHSRNACDRSKPTCAKPYGKAQFYL
ncbi:hypothetical protein COO60DRAFT_92042 [Scenedesmus sp. NREL 46B-D3]|nr:hypothetical protein COO60DRAFT_92042 [Scenedesmus sp. NREL 46B-D3]